MAVAQVNVTYQDVNAKTGVFGFLIDATYAVTPFTELLALIQDLLDATQCLISKVTVATELDISGLTGNTATGAGSFDRVDDQAVLAFRGVSGIDVKLSIPAPVDAMFESSGAHAMQDVDPDSTEVAGIIATGVTEPVLASRAEDVLAFRKGWRKGQSHS